jgi:hypothetical protein
LKKCGRLSFSFSGCDKLNIIFKSSETFHLWYEKKKKEPWRKAISCWVNAIHPEFFFLIFSDSTRNYSFWIEKKKEKKENVRVLDRKKSKEGKRSENPLILNFYITQAQVNVVRKRFNNSYMRDWAIFMLISRSFLIVYLSIQYLDI